MSLYFNIDTDKYSIKVIYSFSNNEFEHGYEILKSKFNEVAFICEEKKKVRVPLPLLLTAKNLYRYVKYSWLRNAQTNFRVLVENILLGSDKEFVMFLTDDSFFYKTIKINEDILKIIRNNPQNTSYKLSLGRNIESLPKSITEDNQILKWNYYSSDSTGDWAYPFSVDGVIYHKKTLSAITSRTLYSNPNSFEGFIVEKVKRQKLFKDGLCPVHSVLVGFELNRVQNISQNNHINIEQGVLNSYFLEGFTLEYKFQNPPHQFHPLLHEIFLINEKSGEKIPLLNRK